MCTFPNVLTLRRHIDTHSQPHRYTLSERKHWCAPKRLACERIFFFFFYFGQNTSSSISFELTHLFILLLPPLGGRDRRGGPVLTFPSRTNHDRIRQEDLRRLIAYLAGIPRYLYIYVCGYVCVWVGGNGTQVLGGSVTVLSCLHKNRTVYNQDVCVCGTERVSMCILSFFWSFSTVA